jgi:predicted ABC-type ATPase
VKKCILIGGPNGAGKTTFATEFLPKEGETITFLNADLIAAGLSPFAPERVAIEASKILLQRIDHCVASDESFGLESTLSGLAHLRHIRRWQDCGYEVELHFLKLPSADFAVDRVHRRVKHGGHDIPVPVIRRRFERGLVNLERYKQIVNDWRIWDTSHGTPRLLDEN